jgi:hypothetical protein
VATRSIRAILALILSPTAIGILAACNVRAAETKPYSSSPDTTSAALVSQALDKELIGDNSGRQDLLQQALDESPNGAAAHWQLGQVRVQGKWQSAAEIERAAQRDKRLAEYARRRDASGQNVADQADLARWCRKYGLDDQGQVHWMRVLQLQPDNAEASSALGLRSFGGMKLTQTQVEQLRARMHQVSLAADRWRPRVAQWLAAIEETSATLPEDFRAKLCRISDSNEMLGLERSLRQLTGTKGKKQDFHRMVLAITLALADNPNPAATEALARGAVFSEFNNVRTAAAAGLKGRPLEHYAPLLLSGMESPIKITGGRESCVFFYSLYQEGALADLRFTCMLDFSPVIEFDDGTLVRAEDAPIAGASRRLPAQYVNSKVAAAVAGAQLASSAVTGKLDQFAAGVAQTNAAIRERNARIAAILRPLTGLDLGDEPMPWWKWWWQDYTEMHNVDGGPDEPPKPVYDYNSSYAYTTVVHCSCFAPGTKVWTLTGRQSIETIKIGDCVLAQDVESGELAYKPVLATTVRKPGPRLRVGLGSESIVATPSHPFWVLGQGWRMTKQLEIGNRVHTPSGSLLIESIEKLKPDPSPAGKSYNLVVSDLHSYFVGDQGILVHDNTPRAATAALLPGLARRTAP